ncbi:MAG: hypothetical protein ACTS73_05870 [Arsenophonus sp. NEOnobi-MAG3]
MIRLHHQVTTTPKITAALQTTKEPASILGKPYGISKLTVAKWQKRDDVDDRLCW